MSNKQRLCFLFTIFIDFRGGERACPCGFIDCNSVRTSFTGERAHVWGVQELSALPANFSPDV